MHQWTELNGRSSRQSAIGHFAVWLGEGDLQAFLKAASGDAPFVLLSLCTSPGQEEAESLPVPRRVKVTWQHESVGTQTMAAGRRTNPTFARSAAARVKAWRQRVRRLSCRESGRCT